MIQDNIIRIREEIASFCAKVGRDPKEITLVGVTKFADAVQVEEAINCGLKDIGENKVQAAGEKFSSLRSSEKVTKHMIGHLQTNKVKQALQLFDLIQSVDSLKLACEIEKQAKKLNKTAQILVQIDTGKEEQKFGLPEEELPDIFAQLAEFKNVITLGMMTIAPLTEDQEFIRKCFRSLKNLFEKVSSQYANNDKIEMRYLSMGMTADYPIAIEEGANMIRVGRAIFSDQ